jgi:hypothetical protein
VTVPPYDVAKRYTSGLQKTQPHQLLGRRRLTAAVPLAPIAATAAFVRAQVCSHFRRIPVVCRHAVLLCICGKCMWQGNDMLSSSGSSDIIMCDMRTGNQLHCCRQTLLPRWHKLVRCSGHPGLN